MKTLAIQLTNICNLNCSFCISKDLMKNKRKDDNYYNELKNHLLQNKNEYDYFVILGGEPFLELELLEKILDLLLYLYPDKPILIHTNGTKLTPEIVYTLNNIPNVEVSVSIDGIFEEDRGLFSLYNKTDNGLMTIEMIKLLKNKQINFVVKDWSKYDLILEVALLQSFFNCKIKLSIDRTEKALNNFNLNDIYNIQRFIIRADKINLFDNDKVVFSGVLSDYCNGYDNPTFVPHSHYINTCTYSDNLKGCGKVRSQMKSGMYELLHKIINYPFNSNFDEDLNSKTEYDTKLGMQRNYNVVDSFYKERLLDTKIQFKDPRVKSNYMFDIPIKEVK